MQGLEQPAVRVGPLLVHRHRPEVRALPCTATARADGKRLELRCCCWLSGLRVAAGSCKAGCAWRQGLIDKVDMEGWLKLGQSSFRSLVCKQVARGSLYRSCQHIICPPGVTALLGSCT